MIYQLNNGYFARGLRESDLDGAYMSWFEDQEVCRYNSHGKFFRTLEYFRNFISDLNHDNGVVWAICHEVDGHIGNISLQSVSLINRHAELAILMGAKQHWGKGVGLEAARLLVNHGFFKLNLERVYCGTSANNIGMRRLAERLGMREEGVRRRHLFLEGEWVDMVEYGLLRVDYESDSGAT